MSTNLMVGVRHRIEHYGDSMHQVATTHPMSRTDVTASWKAPGEKSLSLTQGRHSQSKWLWKGQKACGRHGGSREVKKCFKRIPEKNWVGKG